MQTADEVCRWRTGLARAVRGPHDLQLGSGSDAVVLQGLAASDWQLLGLLERGPRRREMSAAAARLGLSTARCDQLLDMLEAAGALEPGRPASPLDEPGSASSLVGAQVAVVGGGGGLGVVLCVALAAAGASRAALVDDATVSADDVLPGGALHTDVGRRAAHVAAEAVHRLRPDVRTACPTDPDLVVLVSSHVADAPAALPLVQAGTAHLPVVVRAEEVVVGPLVLPGVGACLHCLDLHHRDLDPGWPDAVHLLRRDRRRVQQPSAATASLVAGLVALLAGGAGADPVTARAGVGVLVDPVGATRWHRWSPHAACGCVGWPEPDPSGSHPRSGDRPRRDPPTPAPDPGATMAA